MRKTAMQEITVTVMLKKTNQTKKTNEKNPTQKNTQHQNKAVVVKHHMEFMGLLLACSFSLVRLLVKKMPPLIKIWPSLYSTLICLCL